MLELFLTTLVLFVFFMVLFYFIPIFKGMQYILLVFQFIVCCILISKNFYKKHVLWKEDEYEDETIYNRILPFSPIKKITPVYKNNNNITFSHFIIEKFNSYFSLEHNSYDNECLKNYFVYSEICPITDIIIEDSQIFHENYTEIKINNNKYVYITNKNKYGRLYIFRNYMQTSLEFESTFNYESANKLKKLKEDILSNPLLELKNYIQHSDFICLTLLSVYLIQSIAEKCNNREFNFIKVYNFVIQIAILILYIIRYIKFKKVQKFFFDNEYFYKDKNEENVKEGYYFPNKVFNIDSFPLAISINILLLNLIYKLIPANWHFFSYDCDFELKEKDFCYKIVFIIMFISPYLILYIICSIINAANEMNCVKKYENLMYNWKTNPIISIELSLEKDYELGRARTSKHDYSFYQWRNNYFKVERLKDYNYLNIYGRENGKLPYIMKLNDIYPINIFNIIFYTTSNLFHNL